MQSIGKIQFRASYPRRNLLGASVTPKSKRPRERGQCNSLLLQNNPRFRRGQSIQFLSPMITPMTISRLRLSITFAGMANQFIQAIRNLTKYSFEHRVSQTPADFESVHTIG